MREIKKRGKRLLVTVDEVSNTVYMRQFAMAVVTGGYPFAYQVLGKYIWEAENHVLDDEVLTKFDIAMARYVYDKIWSELSASDKWYLSYIATKNVMATRELLELTKKKKNEFSQYRARLRDKGIIDVSTHGVIKIRLPRFAEYVSLKSRMDNIVEE